MPLLPRPHESPDVRKHLDATQYTDDMSVATNSPSWGDGTTLYGVGVGNTYLTGIWGLQWYDNDGMDCYQQYYDDADYQPVEPVRAVPTNFREVSAATFGSGLLSISYEWDSTSGNRLHLIQCTVGEIVTYPGASPFIWPNPTINDLPAENGGFTDDHMPPTLSSSHMWPRPSRRRSTTATSARARTGGIM